MRKITLMFAFMFAIVSQSHAQFTESFEAAALPATWTVINNGDAGTWVAIDLSASTEITGHTGTHTAGIIYDETTAHDDYLITPAITVAAGVNDRISFWLRSRDPLYPETVDVLLSSTTPTADAFTVELATDLAPASGTAFYKYTYDLSGHVGETVYIAFHSTTLNQFALDLDDVVSDAMPFCSEPNPSAAAITETTADISWPAVPGSVNYEYVLDNVATDPIGAGTSTTSTSYNATLLTNSTTYYFHVRNNCDAAGFSAWSTISITTLAPFTGCLNADNFGQYPSSTFVPDTCDGLTLNVITEAGYAGEYSVVTVTAGQTYTFSSSIVTDYITLSTDDGATGAAYGPTPLTWVSTVDGDIRFYTHADADCTEEGVSRTRGFLCGIAPCVMPAVTYATVNNCPDATFNITANITNLGSATSITVTDDQSSTPQTVTATGVVTFGPYAMGTDVVLTATNDQTGVCNIVSDTLTIDACPPANDECAGAIALVPGADFATAAVNTSSFGTTLGGALPSCQENVAGNIWFTVTVPASGNISIESGVIETSDFSDSVMVAYSGTCGNLTEIACDDDGSSGFFSLLNLTGRTPGEVIYVSVWRYSFDGGGSDGDFQISAYDVSLATNTFESSDSFRAYPNPVKNILNLSYNKNISNVSVFNLLGQEVLSKTMNANESQVDMSALANGAYMVKITADNQIKTIKVIKE